MHSNFKRTARWLQACGKTQGSLEQTSVQIGCHIEEFLEFLQTLSIGSVDSRTKMFNAINALSIVSGEIKRGDEVVFIRQEQYEQALDALCDCDVTGNGVAYLMGWNKDGADQAVLDSNDAKLVDGKPVIKPGGKIGKPEGWIAPNLTQYL